VKKRSVKTPGTATEIILVATKSYSLGTTTHLIRDYKTFLKLQESIGLKQADTQGPIAYGAPPPPLPNHGDAAT
jgi:hypothetical protein